MTLSARPYRGRFAPSPTGPLHLGSLLAAVVSFLEARARAGEWLVRIEDLDPPREQPGAASAILRSLDAHGFGWDGPVLYQSQRLSAYDDALDELSRQGRVFWCRCSRKQLRGRPVYPGTCRAFTERRPNAAARFRVQAHHQGFEDRFQGWQECDLAVDYGDVVIRRRDGLFAYMLAVTVDDRDQGITDVIRGIDLLSSTHWQRSLMAALGAEPPRYGHCPVIVADNGQKLSKQNLAPPLDDKTPAANLKKVFDCLAIPVTPDRPDIMLNQAVTLWRPESLRYRTAVRPDVPDPERRSTGVDAERGLG